MPTRKFSRLPNGYGTVTKLSGNRRKPFVAKVNAHYVDDKKRYDILGYYEDKASALEALAEYNKNPYDINAQKATFREVYELFFDYKYNKSKKKLSKSSEYCTVGAFNKCAILHDKIFSKLRKADLQAVLDDFTLSHAYMEHIRNLFNQMYKFALENDYVTKDYSQFVTINKEDDDMTGVPFSKEDIEKLWNNKDKFFVDVVLIYVYSGFRVSELYKMPLDDIDLENRTFKGGVKTRASKNRIVPIHSKIFDFVKNRHIEGHKNLFYDGDKKIGMKKFYEYFNSALLSCGIEEQHSFHDARHSFATLLDSANADKLAIKRLMGHASQDITEKIYTHKSIEDLRKELEKI